jgi:hypothetical protein
MADAVPHPMKTAGKISSAFYTSEQLHMGLKLQ